MNRYTEKHIYTRKREARPGRWPLISAVGVVALAFVLLISQPLGLAWIAPTNLPVAATTATPPPVPTELPPSQEPEPPDPEFSRPDYMNGFWLSKGVEYFITGEETGEDVREQLDTALAAAAEWQMNTLLMRFPDDGNPIRNKSGTVFDPVAYIIQATDSQPLYLYGILDLHVGDGDEKWDPAVPADVTKMRALAETAAGYRFDGFAIDNYGYAAGDTGSMADRELTGPAEEYWRDCVADAIRTVKSACRAANPDAYVGLLANPVWAHRSDANPNGSPTEDFYQDYLDGHADTLAMAETQLVDFMMVKNYQSTV
ncbi:MAG: hypothetical protein FWE80_07935, partial [Oscillospiraceae bacterium]|nr:hypothetical protein [Oscillospiraceae bacterium]